MPSNDGTRIPISICPTINASADLPLRFAVPFARNSTCGDKSWQVTHSQKGVLPSQSRVVARWPNGNVMWLAVDTLIPPESNGEFALAVVDSCDAANAVPVALQDAKSSLIELEQDKLIVRLFARDKEGNLRAAATSSRSVVENGAVQTTYEIEGELSLAKKLDVRCLATFYREEQLLRIDLCVTNPSRARHDGGYWDLGDPGSILLDELFLKISCPSDSRNVYWESSAGDVKKSKLSEFRIVQSSSGGENWDSPNHIDRDGELSVCAPGYRVWHDGRISEGKRLDPTVYVVGDTGAIGCAVCHFWQKFPTEITTDGEWLAVKLLPSAPRPHEIQGGECLSQVIWLDLKKVDSPVFSRLRWVHDPPIAHCCGAAYTESGVVPFLPAANEVGRPEQEKLLLSALEGDESLFAKREVIDEYGWRNFGDLWADHEQEYSEVDRPIISHYNNQYDPLYGFLVQFLRTGDRRWWQLADDLAKHVIDIDIYHTKLDRALYSGGMFWHTAHYLDAGTSTHRSMSRQMINAKMPAPGGGPANEHNYSSGLMLYYCLTGNARARRSVVGLADWVIQIDRGDLHPLGILSAAPTGSASSTREMGYHGPGRGAGNSINALLDGWLLTQQMQYLTKLDELVRRTISPIDDICSLNLLDAENRWSYTVYLQSLQRLIHFTFGVEAARSLREYARESVKHYAMWMLANERSYFDREDTLEFPTVTWAAQELRKGVVMAISSYLIDDPDQRRRLFDRGIEFLDDSWARLMRRPGRHCTRPIALVLQQGYIDTFLRNKQEPLQYLVSDGSILEGIERVRRFVPQKEQIREDTRSVRGWIRMAARFCQLSTWKYSLERTWFVEVVRQGARRLNLR